jgi:hypothetical protein
MRKLIFALGVAAAIATPAAADTIMRCNDSGDTCIVHTTPGYGTFQNPIVDDYPDEYRRVFALRYDTAPPATGTGDS